MSKKKFVPIFTNKNIPTFVKVLIAIPLLFFALILLVAGLSIIGAIAIHDTDTPNTGIETLMASEEIIKVTAIDLWLEYKQNEIKADMKYEDKLLEVNGTVIELGKDVFNTPFIRLAGLFEGVVCNAEESELLKMSELSKGDFVTVRGRNDGYLIYVTLEDCIIV